MTDVFFAPVKVKKLEVEATLPAKFLRMLDKVDIAKFVNGKKVCIKMHLGGNLGYTTIHPLFVRILVDKIKDCGGHPFVCDQSTKDIEKRGYTKQTFNCGIKALFGPMKKTVTVPINFKTFDTAEISETALSADVLIVFSHVKAHGDSGFGGAGKNIAMGMVPPSTRAKMHALEGSIDWDEAKCKKCKKCIEACPNKANKFNDKDKYEVFWHACKYCRHCILACPEKALTTKGVNFNDFQEAMSRVVKYVLDQYGKDNVLFISMLKDITVFCDCWGFSTPDLVPDIGMLASKDLVAIDRASLDLIKVENYQPMGLPEGMELGEGKHLFEKIHGKDPYVMQNILEKMGVGSTKYELKEVE
nr:DUF362 domain-containing protein [Candidatus Sigynarchaeota archaeon]